MLEREQTEDDSASGEPVWRRIARGLSDVAFPPRCELCEVDLPRKPLPLRLCEPCQEAFSSNKHPTCPRCAAILPKVAGAQPTCGYCQKRKYKFQQTASLGQYRGRLREAILQMKRSENETLILTIGKLLGAEIQKSEFDDIDAVTSIPMHWARRFQRGINTSELLSEAVATNLAIPSQKRILRVQQRLSKQGTLLPGERFRNMRGAFGVNSGYDLTGKHVLIVDDVMTTGATANEAANTLLKNGAAQVSVAVVARGSGLLDDL